MKYPRKRGVKALSKRCLKKALVMGGIANRGIRERFGKWHERNEKIILWCFGVD